MSNKIALLIAFIAGIIIPVFAPIITGKISPEQKIEYTAKGPVLVNGRGSVELEIFNKGNKTAKNVQVILTLYTPVENSIANDQKAIKKFIDDNFFIDTKTVFQASIKNGKSLVISFGDLPLEDRISFNFGYQSYKLDLSRYSYSKELVGLTVKSDDVIGKLVKIQDESLAPLELFGILFLVFMVLMIFVSLYEIYIRAPQARIDEYQKIIDKIRIKNKLNLTKGIKADTNKDT